MTCHLHCIRDIGSYVCIFFKSSCRMFSSVPDPDSVSFIMSVLTLWLSEVRSIWFMSVSKRKWLICDSRRKAGKSEMAGSDTLWAVTCICLFEVFAEHSSAWFPDKRKICSDTFVLEQALQTADYSTSQSSVSTAAWTNWINLSPTKWELCYCH